MKNSNPKPDTGFTRIDLLTVAAMIFILGVLGAQKLAAATAAAGSPTCTGNQAQLVRALHLYSTDNGDFLPYMSDSGSTQPNSNWLVHGATTAPDATNSAKLINPSYSQLAPYLNGNARVFRCPADASTVLVGGKQVPRVRSVSMSQAVGTNPLTPGAKTSTDGPWLDGNFGHTANRTFRTYARLADVVNPRPADLFIFLDEHPDSINDAAFACMGPLTTPTGYHWIDWPATYHNKAGGFGFADGHGEIHGWANAGTLASPPISSTSQLDLAWIALHVSARITDQP